MSNHSPPQDPQTTQLGLAMATLQGPGGAFSLSGACTVLLALGAKFWHVEGRRRPAKGDRTRHSSRSLLGSPEPLCLSGISPMAYHRGCARKRCLKLPHFPSPTPPNLSLQRGRAAAPDGAQGRLQTPAPANLQPTCSAPSVQISRCTFSSEMQRFL